MFLDRKSIYKFNCDLFDMDKGGFNFDKEVDKYETKASSDELVLVQRI